MLEVKRSLNIQDIGTDQMIDFESFLVETTEIMECSGKAPPVAPDRTSHLSRQKSTVKRRSTLTAPQTQESQSFTQSSEHDVVKRHFKSRNRTDEEILALFSPPAQSTPQHGLYRIPQSCLSSYICTPGSVIQERCHTIPYTKQVK